jgi:RNase P/RNase MRP subunit POP5
MANQSARAQGDCKIVLKRKPKKRYLSILHQGRDVQALESITQRCAALFGQVAVEKAGLRIMHSYPNVIVVRCRLNQIHAVLISIALASPAMVSLDMSGNVGRLKKRLKTKYES